MSSLKGTPISNSHGANQSHLCTVFFGADFFWKIVTIAYNQTYFEVWTFHALQVDSHNPDNSLAFAGVNSFANATVEGVRGKIV